MKKCLKITFGDKFPEGFLHGSVQAHARACSIEGIAQVITSEGHVKIIACGDKEAVDTFLEHLPIICNAQGVKLSKRDFGFSLQDLRTAGFLPEAIDNYLALIGGGTFSSEIMDLETLAREFNFDTMNSTGHIRYDVEKLRWLNHKWIDRLEPRALYDRALGFITQQFPQAADIDAQTMINLLQVIKTDMVTLADAQAAIAFFFNEPVQIKDHIVQHVDAASLKTIQSLIAQALNLLDTPDEFMNTIKTSGKTAGVPMKDIFTTLRLALTGQSHGPALNAIITVLGSARSRSRLEQIL